VIAASHLRHFLTAAEHGSFRKAALHLEISESAVSRRIRDLVDHLGASLFHRHHGGIYLTLAGQQFVRRARNALRQIDSGAQDVAAIGRSENGRIKVGIFSSLASGFLSNLLRAYGKQHPSARILTMSQRSASCGATWRSSRERTEWSDCETEQLWTERVFVVIPDGHSLCSREDVAGEDLEEMVDDRLPSAIVRT
jgi:DNA-binding transcriptional LysR family regulator